MDIGFAPSMMRSAVLVLALISNLRAGLIENAISRVGTPYRFGSASERAVDCSGLVQLAYGAVGLPLPRTSALQHQAMSPVSREEIAPGDLVFFAEPRGRRIRHVGIVVDSEHFVHAERSHGVTVERFSHPYYASRLAGFGRPQFEWR